jgi:LemA protein
MAQGYNTTIRRFPMAMLAGMFGFEKKAYFDAVGGAENAPQVKF